MKEKTSAPGAPKSQYFQVTDSAVRLDALVRQSTYC